jgi:dTMP kinase
MSQCRGRLIAFEGPDGCGKTTQAALLAGRLGAVLTREPGGTPLGEALRELLLARDGPGVSPLAEALLMLASRAHHVVSVVAPALESGRCVVTDRFSGSTLAYQGYGRGLDLDELRDLSSWASGGLWPDLNIALDRPGSGLVGAPDRMEAEELAFHSRVAAGFRALAEGDPTRWVIVDGTGSIEEVAVRVAAVVGERLGLVGGGP